MNMNVTETIQQISIKGYDAITVFMDKVSRQRNIIKKKKESRQDIDELVENLKKARNEWVVATMNYEFAADDELIDYYIYSMKAAQLKYDYLLKKAKENDVKWGMEDLYDIKLQRGELI